MTSPDSDKPAFTDSDRQWFAALSGAESSDAQSAAAVQGRALRIALEDRRRRVEADPQLAHATSDDATEASLQVLLQRARDERVFEPVAADTQAPSPTVASNVVAFPWWRRGRPLVALAASVFVGVVLIQQLTGGADLPEPPTMLGAGGVQQASSAAPRQAAERLVAQLRQANLRPGLYQRGSTFIVDVNLLAAEVPSAEPALAEIGLKPAVGFNRVEMSAPR